MRFGVRLFSVFLGCVMAFCFVFPASALVLPSRAGNQEESAESESSDSTQKSGTAKSSTTSAKVSGAFTGSTALSQFLFEKFSVNPISVTVPKSKIGGGSMSSLISKLDDAAHEACLQNGQMEHVTRFIYTYNSQQVRITVSYSNKRVNDRRARGQAVKAKAEEIVASVVTDTMTDAQKAAALYSYMASHVAYDYEALDDYIDQESGANVYTRQTAYSALVQNQAICQGYAKAYKLLCDKANVPCVVVFGTTKRPDGEDAAHAWNRVYLDGAWRTVDTSNTQLHLCTPQGIFVPDSAADRYVPNDQTLVDREAKKYTG